ncbi:sirohydrochlorin ferrochelatase [Herbihabitans rhizosphaerae]|uniref:Sirohydrochlorin ferrochelatase n=1 Tax=Herbihabitans rhizosphaerae TaxID=1872711 RepID=A0A4Q7KD31_9PSEU|nr:CbiX/SirB N-terminal domain-containing protein [Herbihabitans rhizosphaerae]RZS31449.1 sirohydrochlorin ferrochelatase [Herbihabitans rhizosphaerae]
MTSPLIAVAHGSRDPRSAATIGDVVDALRARHSGLDVRAAFLDLSTPRLLDVLAGVHAEGHREVVLAPLLLGRAYHAKVDLPALVAEAHTRFPRLSVRVADVLGPDDRLETAVRARLLESIVDDQDPELGIVLAGTGSSHAPANAQVAAVARRWAARAGCAGVAPAFAAATPDVPAAVARLRARGARRIAVASWFLAPGLLPDRVARLAHEAAPGTIMAEPLDAHPDVLDVITDRYAAVLSPATTAWIA